VAMADAGMKAGVEKGTGGGLKGLVSWIPKTPGFIREVRSEGRRITWPTRKETLTTSLMVGIMAFVMSLFLFGVDQIFGFIVKTLIGLAN
jgi:preprotein translocase subunit SecE